MLRDQIPRPGESTGCGLMTSEHKGDYFVADVFRGKWIVTSRAVCEQQRKYVLPVAARRCSRMGAMICSSSLRSLGKKRLGPWGKKRRYNSGTNSVKVASGASQR